MANNNQNNVLTGSNVQIDELAKHISKSGVIVKPHIGRTRRRVSLPKELLGTSNNVSEDNEFFSEYINQGTLNLIPKSDEKSLVSIETSVRSKVKQLAIACDGTFMTSDVYVDEYLPYFNKKKMEFLDKRDEIVGKWDILIDIFNTKLEAFLDRRGITNKDEIMADVIASIPSQESFRDSFYMDVALTAFPVEENIDMFDSTLAQQVKNSITDTKLLVVQEMIGTLLGETFTRLNNFLGFYSEKGVLNYQQMKPLETLKGNLVKNNILKHVLVEDIITDLDTLTKMSVETDYGCDAAAETAENILIKTYGFMKDIALDEFMDLSNAVLTESEMQAAYQNYKSIQSA